MSYSVLLDVGLRPLLLLCFLHPLPFSHSSLHFLTCHFPFLSPPCTPPLSPLFSSSLPRLLQVVGRPTPSVAPLSIWHPSWCWAGATTRLWTTGPSVFWCTKCKRDFHRFQILKVENPYFVIIFCCIVLRYCCYCASADGYRLSLRLCFCRCVCMGLNGFGRVVCAEEGASR